jgi:hypothetical protein
LPDAGAQAIEVGIVGGLGWCRGGTFKDQASQDRAVPVLANQLPDVLATGAKPALGNLLLHERLERIG